MFNTSTSVLALFVAGLVGLACSRSGLKTTADAGAASGGRPASTISSGTTGGTGGIIGPGGAGGGRIGGAGGALVPPLMALVVQLAPVDSNRGGGNRWHLRNWRHRWLVCDWWNSEHRRTSGSGGVASGGAPGAGGSSVSGGALSTGGTANTGAIRHWRSIEHMWKRSPTTGRALQRIPMGCWHERQLNHSLLWQRHDIS